jgi:parallel beta-helix repeat protein
MRERILVLTLLLLAVACRAEIIIVDDDGLADFNNIQAAIDDSNDWDTIYVFPGIYTGPGNRDIDFLGKAITVRSIAPEYPYIVAATIIDCDANASNPHRGSLFNHAEDANSVLNGLTITNGYASKGSGIYCDNSSPTITYCVITGNTATDAGGGIYCDDSNPTIADCTIRANTAGETGGGIFCWWSHPRIEDCTIIENRANGYPGGGGICTRYSHPIITRCIISHNMASRRGGGLDNGSSPQLRGCIITGNTAGEHGGGIYNSNNGPPLTDCFISCNSATQDGGGIYNWGNTSMLTNCTVSGNTAGGNGGGIYNAYNYDPTLINCVLWGNTDSSGTGEAAQIQGLTPGVSYTCIQDDDPNDMYIPFGGENNNIDDNPMFVRDPNDGGDGWGLGGNDDFGDLHLQNSSPCIDTGDPFFPTGPNSVDIDGQPRIMGEQIDMGADEFFIPVVQMITVSKPQEGDVWVCGSLHEIAWDSDLYEGPVDVLFSEDAGSNWETVESNLPDTGSYMWYLPGSVDSNQCLISVEPNVPDPNIVCINSGLFTIHPDFPGPAAVSKWKSLGGNFDRIGLSQNSGPDTGCVKWQFELDGSVPASVTIGPNDTVHIASEDGKVYTLDANGVQLWSYDTNSPLLSAPTIGVDGTLYVGSQNGKLYAIDIDGNLRWTHTTDGFIYSSPAVSPDNNNIYVGSQDGTLYALGQDGSELWNFKIRGSGIIEGSILASPAIAADGTIYVGGLYDPNLYAIDQNNGSVKWVCNFASGGWPFASPVVATDGTIYQTLLHDPNLYAIDQNDGNIIWAADMTDTESGWFEPYYYEYFDPFSCEYEGALYHLGDSGWSEPALGPDGTIYVSLDDPNLRAVDPNGDFKWVTPLGTMGSFTLTVGSDGLIYAGCDDGNLYVVDANGWDVARFDSNNYWLSFPVISEDNIVMVSDSRDNSMLISHPNNVVWAIEGDCEGEDLDLYWQGGAQDLDNNGVVDFNDLYILAGDWLRCTDCSNWMVCWPPEVMYFTGDINRDKYVDFADFALLAERWLGGY